MRHQTLREIAKFASGLVAADFLCGIWFWGAGMLPVPFMGTTITAGMVGPWLIFDVVLFLFLVHYGWHTGKIPNLRERTYTLVAGILFTIVALAHFIRIFTGAEFSIFGWTVPLWLSWIGVIVTTYLAYMSFHLTVRLKPAKRK
ncbi:MAG: hypothetical protein ACREGH_00780 [Minisyncoccia bacterium]